MPYGDLARIRTNIGAMNAANALNYVNRELSIHQLRIATGKRLNSVQEGPADFSMAKELEGIARRWHVALTNVQDTQNLFSTAETGAVAIKDILIRMADLAEKAASDTISPTTRGNIKAELKQLAKEIDQLVESTQYRGNKLLSAQFSGEKTTWVGPTANSSESALKWKIHEITNGLTFKSLIGITASQIDVSTVEKAKLMLASLIKGIETLDKHAINLIGSYGERLAIKEANIAEHETDVWATYSRIMNADMAEEQLAITKYTILQQAAVAGLAQANTAPSFVLGLLGG